MSIKQELHNEISRFKSSIHTQTTGSYHNLFICKHQSKYFADDLFRLNKSSRNHLNNLFALDDIHGLLILSLINPVYKNTVVRYALVNCV